MLGSQEGGQGRKRSKEHTAGVPKVRIAAALAELCGSWQSCGTRTGCLLAAPCGVTGQGQQVLPVGIEMYQLSFPALCCFFFFSSLFYFLEEGCHSVGRGSCVSSISKQNLKYWRKSEKRSKRQVQSDSFLPTHSHGCILFEAGWSVSLHLQVNRGFALELAWEPAS